jgi:hypothetical protein
LSSGVFSSGVLFFGVLSSGLLVQYKAVKTN